MSDKLSASEALYGFCAWLTCRKEKTVMSATNDAAPIPPLIGEFCKVNNLSDPRDNYHEDLIHPSDSGAGGEEVNRGRQT